MSEVFQFGPPSTITLGEKLTLTGAKRYESARRKWGSETVLIYSKEHCAWWRESGAGYTMYVSAAGHYSFDDAYTRTKHCDRDKGIVFYKAPRLLRSLHDKAR